MHTNSPNACEASFCTPLVNQAPTALVAQSLGVDIGVCSQSNAPQWHHIAEFLAALPQRGAPADGKRSAAVGAPRPLNFPDGNHGENPTEAQA
jgi:hypothetical protein